MGNESENISAPEGASGVEESLKRFSHECARLSRNTSALNRQFGSIGRFIEFQRKLLTRNKKAERKAGGQPK